MGSDYLKWAAGRDLALLRRCANPQVQQSETLNYVALLRRLFLEGAIHKYWKLLRPNEADKLQIEYTSIRTRELEDVRDYLLFLTGDQWSDLLVGGLVESVATASKVHSGMTLGPLNQHFERSIILATPEFSFTPMSLIRYHAYKLGEVHLASKEVQQFEAIGNTVAKGVHDMPFSFGSNGPSSLAIKGFANRVTRSVAYKHMYAQLSMSGHIPDDIEFPNIDPFGLRENIQKAGFDSGLASLKWTERARVEGISSQFPFKAA